MRATPVLVVLVLLPAVVAALPAECARPGTGCTGVDAESASAVAAAERPPGPIAVAAGLSAVLVGLVALVRAHRR